MRIRLVCKIDYGGVNNENGKDERCNGRSRNKEYIDYSEKGNNSILTILLTVFCI